MLQTTYWATHRHRNYTTLNKQLLNYYKPLYMVHKTAEQLEAIMIETGDV